MPTWQKWAVSLIALALLFAGLWLANLLAWAQLPSPIPCFNEAEAEVVEVVGNVESVDNAETANTAEAVANDSTVAE